MTEWSSHLKAQVCGTSLDWLSAECCKARIIIHVWFSVVERFSCMGVTLTSAQLPEKSLLEFSSQLCSTQLLRGTKTCVADWGSFSRVTTFSFRKTCRNFYPIFAALNTVQMKKIYHCSKLFRNVIVVVYRTLNSREGAIPIVHKYRHYRTNSSIFKFKLWRHEGSPSCHSRLISRPSHARQSLLKHVLIAIAFNECLISRLWLDWRLDDCVKTPCEESNRNGKKNISWWW